MPTTLPGISRALGLAEPLVLHGPDEAYEDTDEDRALDARLANIVEDALAAEQELPSARARLAELEAKRSALERQLAETCERCIDARIAAAYRSGALVATVDATGAPIPDRREARLRRIAGEPDGLAALDEEISELAPHGRRTSALHRDHNHHTAGAPGAGKDN